VRADITFLDAHQIPIVALIPFSPSPSCLKLLRPAPLRGLREAPAAEEKRDYFVTAPRNAFLLFCNQGSRFVIGDDRRFPVAPSETFLCPWFLINWTALNLFSKFIQWSLSVDGFS